MPDEAAGLPVGTVTFVLSDIEGSTGLWDADPDAMAAALGIHDQLVAASVARFGGHLVKTKGEGDSTFSVFADPAAAVAAADAIQAAIAAQAWPVEGPLKVRMSVTTGMAELRDGDYFGPTVNRAARIRGLAHGGEILLSSSTYSLLADSALRGCVVEDRGEQELRGLTRPERVWALAPGQSADPTRRPAPARRSRSGGGARQPVILGGAAAAAVALVVAIAVAAGGDGGGDVAGPTTAPAPPAVQIVEVAVRAGDGETEYEVRGDSDHVVAPPYEIRVMARDTSEENFWWWSDPATLEADGGWNGKLVVDRDDTSDVRISAVAILTPVAAEVRGVGSALSGETHADQTSSTLPPELEAALTTDGPKADGVQAVSDEITPDE